MKKREHDLFQRTDAKAAEAPEKSKTETSPPGQPWRTPRLTIAIGTTLGLSLVICVLLQSLLAGSILDRLLTGHFALSNLFAAMLVIVLVKTVLSGVARLTGFHSGAVVREEARQSILSKILQLGPSLRSTHRSGGIMHDAVEGVEALNMYYGLFIPQMFISLLSPLILCGGLAILDPVTGLLLFLTIPIAPFLMALTRSRFRSVSKQYHETANELSADFLDSIQGLPTLKMFNRGRFHGRTLRARSENLRKKTMSLLAINQTAIFLLDWGFAVSITTAGFVIAAIRHQAGALSLGEAIAVVLITTEIIRQFNLMGAFFFAGAGGRAMIKRVRSFLEQPSPVEKSDQPRSTFPTPPFEIRFENVSFGYQQDKQVLSNLSFQIAPGETVGLLGENGAGKSTIVQLLLRFAEPGQGRILLGGEPLSDVSIQWLRSQIAVVSQHTWLFHDTIAGNLRVAKPNASDSEMNEALEAACLLEWVRSLPLGLETPLGERGERLSGGQGQRLSIARAFLKNAPVLILDEPTAHVDAATSAILNESLRRLGQGRTVLYITHQPEALTHANRILLLAPNETMREHFNAFPAV